MDLETALAALDDVKTAMHDKFGAHHGGRLDQLDAALATARMAVEHLHDEEERERDLAQRILNRETVHQKDEVISPVGRSLDETRQVAAGGVR